MAEVQDATNVGKPLPIVLAEEDHHFVLDEEALESILLKDDIKDRNVVVVFVAGSYPKGKSILMDFVLRYMKATYHLNLINEDAHWIGSDDKPLDGFSWLGGSDRDTTGILMWSEVFKATLDDGEKVAIVLLVTTQGTFNSESTVNDCAMVFALSTLLSSNQIYNLKVNIQEDNLHHLPDPLQPNYGAEEGKKIFDKILQISDKQHPEHLTLRKHITSRFSDIVCHLRTNPGQNVATNPNVDGKLSDVEPNLKKNIITWIPTMLSPNRLILKKIGGQKIKAKELVHYFKAYFKLCTGAELPEPKSMFDTTAEANNLSAVASAREVYRSMMDTICGGNTPYLNSDSLDVEHFEYKDIAIELLLNIAKRKMGVDEFSESYKFKLENDIDEDFLKFKSQNESKNVFKSARTPAVFFSVAVVCYFISGSFNFFGIYSVALIMGLALLILKLW